MPDPINNGGIELSDTEPGYIHSVAPDPRRQDPIENCRAREEGVYGFTAEKKYYEFEQPNQSVHIKRNVIPSEYMVNSYTGELGIPYMIYERLKNEAATIKFIQQNTTIPTPNIRCAFEDRGCYYIITDIVPGVMMADLPNDQKAAVFDEIQGYVAQMYALKSSTMGGILGDVIPPSRICVAFRNRGDPPLKLRLANTAEFVFCHDDLSQFNIIVDEKTLKINAILDWEHAGYFPPEFDAPFYRRRGPSAIGDEENDIPKLLEVLESWKVVPPHE